MALVAESESQAKIHRDINELMAVVDWYGDILKILGAMEGDDSFTVSDIRTELTKVAAKMHDDIRGTVIVA